jgi:hypothetical protein
MAVLKLPSATPSRPRRLTATLTLTLIPKKDRRKDDLGMNCYRGEIEVKGFRFDSDDGNPIGLACFVMNVATLDVVSPTFPAGTLQLRASAVNVPRELMYLTATSDVQRSEEWYLKRAFTGMKVAYDSKRQRKDILDRWNDKLLPPVLARIPTELQVNTRAQYGIHDEDGLPVTPYQHQQRMRSARFLGQFAKAVSGETSEERAENLNEFVDPHGLFDIPMEAITQLLDSANESPSDPVVIGAEAFVPLKKLLSKFGIGGMPQTVGELRGSIEYCNTLYRKTRKDVQLGKADQELWDGIVEKTTAEQLPELAPSLLAWKAGDIEALREIHRTRMTFGEMARHYHPEHGWLAPAHWPGAEAEAREAQAAINGQATP